MSNFVRKDLFVHDMVHNNPGLEAYESDYLNPEFLKERGYDGKTFELFGCAQYGLLWDDYDAFRNDGKKVFPIGSSERAWVEHKKRELTKAYDVVVAAGLKVSFMMDIIVLPSIIKELEPAILNDAGKIDIRKPEMKVVLDCLFDEMFREFPQISGIYVRYGETYVGEKYNTPYHCGNHPIVGEEVDFHKFLITYLTDKVCKEHNREIYYRTWGFGAFQYDPDLYLAISNAVNTHENLYFCVKHTNGDFRRTYAFNQCLNIGKHQQVVEVQAAREYEGKGAYPNYIGAGVIHGFEELKWKMGESETQSLKEVINVPDSLVKGVWTWSRGGGWDGPYINGKNGENGGVEVKDGRELWTDINAYVISKWAKDTSHSDRYYVIQYAKEILGMSDKDSNIFYEILIKSAHAVLLGIGCNHSFYEVDPLWTRDQNIDYDRFLSNIQNAIDANATDVMLAERRESVVVWEEIVRLAEKLSDDLEVKDYIVNTCHYGRILYSLYEVLHQIQIQSMLDAEANFNSLVDKYERLWQEWEEMKRTKKGFPTLYVKDSAPLDLKGYYGNTGFDIVLEKCKSIQRVSLKEMCDKLEVMPIWNEKEISWEERRKQIIELLCEEEYGFLPKEHDNLTWEVVSEEERFCAGKVLLSKVLLTAHFGEDKFTFPVYVSMPSKEGKYPFFVHINFRDCVPDRYLPVEEICDRGFAVLSFCYEDVTRDEDMLRPQGIYDVMFKGIQKKPNHCGKIRLWAWAASRVMDYAETLPKLDFTNATVVGHSRLGKTALLTGALDERFTCAISNDSGCSGAAITRGKRGETIRDITEEFGHWFCDNYFKYVDKEYELPFDQHYLIAAMAPRKVYIASAWEDIWADPNAEYLSAYAASEVYEKLGVKGAVFPEHLPEIGSYYHNGNIAYHLRSGKHYFSREDWLYFLDYLK